MPGIPDRYDNTFRTLQRLTGQLHQMMESGEFYTLSLSARRKLLRKVKRLYNRLVGPVSAPVLVGAVAAGVLFLAGCFQPTVPDLNPDPEPEPDPPAQVFVPNFSTAGQANPYGIGMSPGGLFAQVQPVFADLDADGDLDLVYPVEIYNGGAYGNYRYHHIQYHQDGVPGFDAAADLGLTRSDNFYTSYIQTDLKTFVDIDGDGDLDAVVSGYYYAATGVLLAENTGTVTSPSFAPPVDTPFVALGGDYAIDIAFADVDADGDLDMLYLKYPGGAPYLSRNNGTADAPDFPAPEASPYTDQTLANHTFHSIEVTDLDNDGDVDILVGAYFDDTVTTGARLLFYENTSTTSAISFAAVVVNPFGLTFPGSYSWGTSASSLQGGVGIAAADVDGDGDIDLLVGPYTVYAPAPDYTSSLFFFENTGGLVDVE